MKKKVAVSPRSKGETVIPIATLALVQKIGVTRASKEIGVSTTTLHKARKGNIVSKVVEIAAESALAHLGDHPGKRSMSTPEAKVRDPVVRWAKAHGVEHQRMSFRVGVKRAFPGRYVPDTRRPAAVLGIQGPGQRAHAAASLIAGFSASRSWAMTWAGAATQTRRAAILAALDSAALHGAGGGSPDGERRRGPAAAAGRP
jgi:hypothetical protein